MDIWNTDVIATKLAKDEIDQKQKTVYYVACFYLQVIGTVMPMFLLGYSYSINLFTFASYVITVAVFHLGALKVYRACANHKKASVLDTLVVLGLPISIKIQIGYWLTYFFITYILNVIQASPYAWVIYGFITMPIMVWLQFQLIKRAVDKNYV
ncbi:hypothetical protein GCM10009098_06380 [Rheinheimera aquimaris]|uniref:Uncharacterized protein n=1 Tax=Rheinheimera aquimaris TaxID=412437 RepID=A0ABN1DF55_9GAMM|nr:hypothetical protein [Rheinheimera aquimaris]MCB5212187.1 hypothetical protein [Rheinheimera aquimaris]